MANVLEGLLRFTPVTLFQGVRKGDCPKSLGGHSGEKKCSDHLEVGIFYVLVEFELAIREQS